MPPPSSSSWFSACSQSARRNRPGHHPEPSTMRWATTSGALPSASRRSWAFQAIERTGLPHRLHDVPDRGGDTITHALETVLAADGRYELRSVSGLAIVRPKGAWNDRADPLNQRAGSVHTTASPVVFL